MTMTIGAWCIGNAWHAYITARRWQWSLVYIALIYLWLFGITEMGVLIIFSDKLVLGHPIAWLYLITLSVNVLTAILGIVDWVRLKPATERLGGQTSSGQFALTIGFVLFVGFLALYGLTAQAGALGTNGGIFPEVMSPFTLRSFAVFYLSIALAVIPSLWDRNLQAILHHSFAQYGLVFFITLATFIYIHLFNFAERPGGLLYFIAYFAVGIPLPVAMYKLGTGLGKK